MKKAKLSSKKVVKKVNLAKKPAAKKAAPRKTQVVPQHTRTIKGKKVVIKAFKRKPKSC